MRFCVRCDNSRFICEAHPDKPWDSPHARALYPEACDADATQKAGAARLSTGGFIVDASTSVASYTSKLLKMIMCSAWPRCNRTMIMIRTRGALNHVPVRPQIGGRCIRCRAVSAFGGRPDMGQGETQLLDFDPKVTSALWAAMPKPILTCG